METASPSSSGVKPFRNHRDEFVQGRWRSALPKGRTVTRVELLRVETNIPFHAAAGKIEFTIPKIIDYEVAAIHSA